MHVLVRGANVVKVCVCKVSDHLSVSQKSVIEELSDFK